MVVNPVVGVKELSLIKKMDERKGHMSGEGRGPGEEDDLKPLFALGQVVGTPGALEAMQEAEQDPLALLFRHVTGDFGDLAEEDIEENELSVQRGYRILSAYKLNTGSKIWIITEADRSVTSFLLPSEY